MNEVTKIHLGRQEFSISLDAYHQLKKYLEDIKDQIKDNDVINEIELRMSELLIEHGIDTNKVILLNDIDLLKKQLGEPEDFKEDTDELDGEVKANINSKRLFRNTKGAMIAGVASGLANYFDVDVLIIRLLFILMAVFTAGWAILLYIVLWLLVPEAKTSSDQLLMAGKSVNVNNLKEFVERADVKSAAHRANQVLVQPIDYAFKLILKILGLFLIILGLSILFGLLAAITYFISKNSVWAKNNIFPIGLRENILLYIVLTIIVLMTLFIILFGIAIFNRKWPIHAWITGILIGLIFIGLTISGALSAVVYPDVKNRYTSDFHSTTRVENQFQSININGNNEIPINFSYSSNYSVTFNYYSNPNVSAIKTSVNNGTLNIDYSHFNNQRNCQSLCIPNNYVMSITINSPSNINQYNNLNTYPTESMKAIPTAPIY